MSSGERFDVVVIGSGIGGLVCASLLTKEGLRVCVLEKNPQIGGALQTYARDKTLFDSGVHYMGGLAPGQNLYQIFRYLGVMDQLRLVQMEAACFDKILIGGDPKEYVFAQGYDRFVAALAADFPTEVTGIRAYADSIRDVCARFPLYNLRSGGVYAEKAGVLEIDTKTHIASLTPHPVLREVLAGNTILYAGEPEKTPFYIHALVLNSFIESAWKCTDGGSRIGQVLARSIRDGGGQVRTRAEVVRIEEGRVILQDGSSVEGKGIISSLHPAQTLALTPNALIRQAYRHRIAGLENSVGCFCVNIVLQRGMVPYVKHNYYYQRPGCAWTMADYTEEDWPRGYALFLSPSREDPAYAASATLMTYMRFADTLPWSGSFNTVASIAGRGDGYEAFKADRYHRLLDSASEKFPWLPASVVHWYASTPLSFRDYLGTPEGSLYGIAKDFRDPVKTIIGARTKVPHLFLTGQSLNLHGILGAAISSLATCAELLGRDDFVEKIRMA